MSKFSFKLLLATVAFPFLIYLASVCFAPNVNAALGAVPQDLVGDPVPSDDAIDTLGEWFTDQTGEVINATYFTSWATQAIGSKLYIGLSAARPAEDNGALLAVFDGTTISAISELIEQGINDFAVNGNLLHTGGADPSDLPPPGGHQWDGGNFYTYDTSSGSLSKYRCTLSGGVCVSGTYVLPNVIHVFGEYVNESGHIFISTGSDDGTHPAVCVNGVDCFGEIYKSTNYGATWTRLARFATGDPVNPITSYRIYDVIGFNDKLYAGYVAAYDTQGFLAESSDNGVTWTNVAAMPSLHNRGRLFTYKNKLFGMGYDRDTLYGLDTSGNVTTYPLGFTVGPGVVTEYSFFAQDLRGNLYTISSDGILKYTSNVTAWGDYSNLGAVVGSNKFGSLSYWQSADAMIISGMGTNAKLWKVDVSPFPFSQAGVQSCVSKSLSAPVLFQPGHNLLPISTSPGEVMLNWLAVDGASSYNVLYGEQSGKYNYSLLGVRGSGLISQIIGRLAKNTTYYYVVQATDGCSFSSYSIEWPARSPGTKEIAAEDGVMLVSNPGNEDLRGADIKDTPVVTREEVSVQEAPKSSSGVFRIILEKIISVFRNLFH